jgi:hypothetical protein
MNVMELLRVELGMNPMAAVAFPSGYAVLYSICITIAIAVGLAVALRVRAHRSVTRLRYIVLALLIVSVLIFSFIRETLFVDYIGQGEAVSGESKSESLVVPLPFPIGRSDAFAPYAPNTGPYFRRISGSQMRSIVFSPPNILGTYITLTLHLASFAAAMFSLACLSVLGPRSIIRYFAAANKGPG